MKCQTLLRIFQMVILLSSLLAYFVSPQLTNAESTSSRAAHYIVFEKQDSGAIAPVYYRSVELAAPLISVSDHQLANFLARSSRNDQRMAVVLQAEDGRIAYQNGADVSRWLRGEFHGKEAGSPIDGHILPAENPAFVVRVPKIKGTTLVLKDTEQKTIAQFDLVRLAAKTPRIILDQPTLFTSQSNSNSAANRVDLLIMGDGYTDAQSSQFKTDAINVANQFFLIPPYSLYQNYFNIHTLFTASNQSGADHPPYEPNCRYRDPNCCGDPVMLSDPLQGQMVNTAFDSQFCARSIHRLLVVNSSRVMAAAAAVTDWDQILVIVNDATYGGSGGAIMVTSADPAATQIAQHEFGHVFVDLADEYATAYPGYPACSDIAGPICESNVTDVIDPQEIKWNPWILPTTPIPTPDESSVDDRLVGLFEGARYQATDMYRSGQNCIMRALGAPYCQVPSQSFVLALYNGDWGVPQAGIRLIEPDSASPKTDNITLIYPNSQLFQASALQPVGGPSLKIQWLVDGVAVMDSNADTFTYTPTISDVGNHVEVQLLVQDTTPLVHNAMAGNSLQDSRLWTVVTMKEAVYLPIMLKHSKP